MGQRPRNPGRSNFPNPLDNFANSPHHRNRDRLRIFLTTDPQRRRWLLLFAPTKSNLGVNAGMYDDSETHGVNA